MSRNRPGHPFQKPADIPSSQRVKGKIIWAYCWQFMDFSFPILRQDLII